jgi:hypothetical protein
MFLRKCRKVVDGGAYTYWQLEESYRTERGPRQRVVAYLGDIEKPNGWASPLLPEVTRAFSKPAL